ncbi:response regulator [Streptomyces sp. NPDC054787]
MTRVLVVEGGPHLLRARQINLQARKFESQEAGTGADALRFAAVRTPDVILLDLGLSDMDSIDVIKSIRRRSAVPILVLAARCTSQEKARVLDTGANDDVTKPFSIARDRLCRPALPPGPLSTSTALRCRRTRRPGPPSRPLRTRRSSERTLAGGAGGAGGEGRPRGAAGSQGARSTRCR